MINYKIKKQKGFTVLESIVAIFVLSLVISGVFTAVQTSLTQASITKDEVKAFYLAQEAIEIIRNKRDSNQLIRIAGLPSVWLTGISEAAADPCYFGKVCRMEVSAPTVFTNCGNSWNTCPNLRQNSTSNLLGYNGAWTLTNLKREVMFESINANEIAVIIRVTWTRGTRTFEFKVKTHLLNWI